MIELDAENVVAYARERGWIAGAARAELLSGGVSNCVLRVTPLAPNDRQAPFIVKQSRPRLRTRQEWFSDVARIHREEDAQRLLAASLPDRVPRVLFADRENYAYAMEHTPTEAANWKELLLAGERDEAKARAAGELLRDLHAMAVPQAFAARIAFVQLRVEPFYRRVQERHPDLGDAIEPLIANLLSAEVALTHGDFSPKNLLVWPGGIMLVDHETAHLGQPAMDVGFFFSHLFLKAIRGEGMLPLIEAAKQGYGDGPGFTRGMGHLGVCLLARIDGTSPVDYLPEESQKETARAMGRLFLQDPDRAWEQITDQKRGFLRNSALTP